MLKNKKKHALFVRVLTIDDALKCHNTDRVLRSIVTTRTYHNKKRGIFHPLVNVNTIMKLVLRFSYIVNLLLNQDIVVHGLDGGYIASVS